MDVEELGARISYELNCHGLATTGSGPGGGQGLVVEAHSWKANLPEFKVVIEPIQDSEQHVRLETAAIAMASAIVESVLGESELIAAERSDLAEPGGAAFVSQLMESGDADVLIRITPT
jgi:hypothetical protein